MKKKYFQPAMTAVELKTKNHILLGSNLTDINSNADLNYGGGSITGALIRENKSIWDEEW